MPVETVVGNDSINVEIRMVEGPQATIDRVIIKGNDRTHEHVIRRCILIRENCSASGGRCYSECTELANLGHFDPEKISPTHYRTRKPER